MGIRQTTHFARAVRDHPRFQLLRDPQLNILLYRYLPDEQVRPWTPAAVDHLNISIQRAQRQAGGALVSLGGTY